MCRFCHPDPMHRVYGTLIAAIANVTAGVILGFKLSDIGIAVRFSPMAVLSKTLGRSYQENEINFRYERAVSYRPMQVGLTPCVSSKAYKSQTY